MVTGFTTYAQRTVVIVDSEGDMAEYVRGLIRSGKLPDEDVLQFEANLEDSNFSPEEMVQVLTELAASPADDRPAVRLTLPLSVVLTAHEERRHKTRENPGIAGTLLKLAEDPAYGGPVTIAKPDFACALADRMLAEVSESPDIDQAIEAQRPKRPLLATTRSANSRVSNASPGLISGLVTNLTVLGRHRCPVAAAVAVCNMRPPSVRTA